MRSLPGIRALASYRRRPSLRYDRRQWPINEAKAFVNGLTAGESVRAAVAVGILSLVLILALGR